MSDLVQRQRRAADSGADGDLCVQSRSASVHSSCHFVPERAAARVLPWARTLRSIKLIKLQSPLGPHHARAELTYGAV